MTVAFVIAQNHMPAALSCQVQVDMIAGSVVSARFMSTVLAEGTCAGRVVIGRCSGR